MSMKIIYILSEEDNINTSNDEKVGYGAFGAYETMEAALDVAMTAKPNMIKEENIYEAMSIKDQIDTIVYLPGNLYITVLLLEK